MGPKVFKYFGILPQEQVQSYNHGIQILCTLKHALQ